MKRKKIFLLFAAFMFAAVAGYNIHLAQSNQNSDVSLADIAVMAQANGENPIPGCVDVTFFPGNFTESDTYSTCYLLDGRPCGIQRYCVPDDNGIGCNETMCQGHTSG